MLSILFIRRRARATRNAQGIVSVDWVWEEKSVPDWDADLKDLKAREEAESSTRAELRAVTAQWQARVDRTQSLTRSIVRLGKIRFRNDPEKLALFEKLQTSGTSRDSIRKQGIALRDAWAENDAKWIPLQEPDEDGEEKIDVTMDSFSKLLDDCEDCEKQQSQKLTAWRNAATALNTKAKAIDGDNVAWYAEATTRFPAGTQFGDLIRSSVPTTSNPADDVGQAVITNLIAADGTIHFDCAAEHATRLTYFHQPPDADDFQLIQADTEETSVTLRDQAPGKHRFKAFGSNSQGQGDESEVAEIELAAPAANTSGDSAAPRNVIPVSSTPVESEKAKSA